jgi:hypothetical protein
MNHLKSLQEKKKKEKNSTKDMVSYADFLPL